MMVAELEKTKQVVLSKMVTIPSSHPSVLNETLTSYDIPLFLSLQESGNMVGMPSKLGQVYNMSMIRSLSKYFGFGQCTGMQHWRQHL